jgi:peptide/nickel transport system permease protein
MSILPDGRFVDDAPYDPNVDLSAVDRSDMDASNWLLVWRKFRRHRLGLVSGIFLLVAYLAIPFAGFFSPYTPNERSAEYLYHPPQAINLWHENEFIGPFVYPTQAKADLENFRWNYTVDETLPMPLHFFCTGTEYNLFGFVPTKMHLFCAPEGATVFILGSDRLGRDIFSRISYGAQLSLTVGLIGITVSFLLGITLG